MAVGCGERALRYLAGESVQLCTRTCTHARVHGRNYRLPSLASDLMQSHVATASRSRCKLTYKDVSEEAQHKEKDRGTEI